MALRRRIAKWYAAVVLGLLGVLAVSMANGVNLVRIDGPLIAVLNPLSAAIPAAIALAFAIRDKGPARLLYICFAAAMGFSTAGVIGNALGPSPFPGVFDYINVGLYCSGAVALLFASANRSLTYILDGLIISACLLFVTWGFVLQPVVEAFDGNYEYAAVSLVGPSFDVVLIAVALVTLVRGTTLLSKTMLVVLCIGVTMDATAWTVWAFNGRSAPQPAVTMMLWIASGMILSIGVVFGPRQEAPRLKPINFKFMLLPYPAVLTAIATGIYMALSSSEMRSDVFVPAVVALICLMLRQLLAGFENVRMARNLETAVSKLQVREVELNHLALHDPLTSLPNRRFMEQRLVKAEPRISNFAVLLLDVDNFKLVNDEFGHDAGDALLIRIAQHLSASVRANDVVVRLGGDEFAIVLPGSTKENALEIAGRIGARLKGQMLPSGKASVGKVGVSIGLAFGEDMAELDSVMRKADMAMYERKRTAGKGGLAIYSAA